MPADILNHRLITERYFFPRQESFDDPFWIDCGDARLACHYHEVSPQALTVVHFHGNGEIVTDYVDFLPGLFARFGCNCLLAEFRGYGMSTGRPELGKILDDVEITLDNISSPPERTVFFGRSVGTIPAIHAAALWPEAAGLIVESGIADVLERLLLRIHPMELGVSPQELQNAVDTRLDQKSKIESFAGPLLIMHTAHDGLVDVEHAEKLYAWATGPDKRLEIFPHGDHNSIMMVNADAYFSLVGQFLEKAGKRQAIGSTK